MSLTRRDLARALKQELGGSIQDHDRWLQALMEVVTDKVSQGERIQLRGFGSFEARTIKAHQTIVPVTGKKLKNPKSYTVDFRPAKAFKERLKKGRRRRGK